MIQNAYATNYLHIEWSKEYTTDGAFTFMDKILFSVTAHITRAIKQTLGFHGNDHFRYCVITVPKKLWNQKPVSHQHMICNTEPKKCFPVIEILGLD